jgi:hypothetical protein
MKFTIFPHLAMEPWIKCSFSNNKAFNGHILIAATYLNFCFSHICKAVLPSQDILLSGHKKPSTYYYFAASIYSSFSSLLDSFHFITAAQFLISFASLIIFSFSLSVRDRKRGLVILISSRMFAIPRTLWLLTGVQREELAQNAKVTFAVITAAVLLLNKPCIPVFCHMLLEE